MAKTLQEQYHAGLLKYGETEVKRLSGCIVMTRTKIGGTPVLGFYYLGKSGSVRFGQTRAASIPSSGSFKDMLLKLVLIT